MANRSQSQRGRGGHLSPRLARQGGPRTRQQARLETQARDVAQAQAQAQGQQHAQTQHAQTQPASTDSSLTSLSSEAPDQRVEQTPTRPQPQADNAGRQGLDTPVRLDGPQPGIVTIRADLTLSTNQPNFLPLAPDYIGPQGPIIALGEDGAPVYLSDYLTTIEQLDEEVSQTAILAMLRFSAGVNARADLVSYMIYSYIQRNTARWVQFENATRGQGLNPRTILGSGYRRFRKVEERIGDNRRKLIEGPKRPRGRPWCSPDFFDYVLAAAMSLTTTTTTGDELNKFRSDDIPLSPLEVLRRAQRVMIKRLARHTRSRLTLPWVVPRDLITVYRNRNDTFDLTPSEITLATGAQRFRQDANGVYWNNGVIPPEAASACQNEGRPRVSTQSPSQRDDGQTGAGADDDSQTNGSRKDHDTSSNQTQSSHGDDETGSSRSQQDLPPPPGPPTSSPPLDDDTQTGQDLSPRPGPPSSSPRPDNTTDSSRSQRDADTSKSSSHTPQFSTPPDGNGRDTDVDDSDPYSPISSPRLPKFSTPPTGDEPDANQARQSPRQATPLGQDKNTTLSGNSAVDERRDGDAGRDNGRGHGSIQAGDDPLTTDIGNDDPRLDVSGNVIGHGQQGANAASHGQLRTKDVQPKPTARSPPRDGDDSRAQAGADPQSGIGLGGFTAPTPSQRPKRRLSDIEHDRRPAPRNRPPGGIEARLNTEKEGQKEAFLSRPPTRPGESVRSGVALRSQEMPVKSPSPLHNVVWEYLQVDNTDVYRGLLSDPSDSRTSRSNLFTKIWSDIDDAPAKVYQAIVDIADALIEKGQAYEAVLSVQRGFELSAEVERVQGAPLHKMRAVSSDFRDTIVRQLARIRGRTGHELEEIRRHDLESFICDAYNDGWLSDKALYAGMLAVLDQYIEDSSHNLDTSGLRNTQYPYLVDPMVWQPFAAAVDQKATLGKELLPAGLEIGTQRDIYIPINTHESHWILCVILMSAGEFYVLDSKPHADRAEMAKKYVQPLMEVLQFQGHMTQRSFVGAEDLADYNCGMFVILNTASMMSSKTPTFKQPTLHHRAFCATKAWEMIKKTRAEDKAAKTKSGQLNPPALDELSDWLADNDDEDDMEIGADD